MMPEQDALPPATWENNMTQFYSAGSSQGVCLPALTPCFGFSIVIFLSTHLS